MTGEGSHPRLNDIVAALDQLCEKYDATRTQIALAFTRTHQANVIPIIGTQQPERILEAAKAAEIILTPREFYDLVEAYRGEKVWPSRQK